MLEWVACGLSVLKESADVSVGGSSRWSFNEATGVISGGAPYCRFVSLSENGPVVVVAWRWLSEVISSNLLRVLRVS